MYGWQVATVRSVKRETSDVKSFTLEPETQIRFKAGQHIDVRLTAPDGYQAQRSYSIASAPEQTESIDITIELLKDGEVSPYFHQVIETSDQIEIRGPIGGPFTWQADSANNRLLLIAGGSGIVPIMSMLRHRTASGMNDSIPALLIYSSRSADHIIYKRELHHMQSSDDSLDVMHTLTRVQPSGWQGATRRVDLQMMSDALDRLDKLSDVQHLDNDDGYNNAMCYICGPSDFVENVATHAVELGIPPQNVRTERFGPTGT